MDMKTAGETVATVNATSMKADEDEVKAEADETMADENLVGMFVLPVGTFDMKWLVVYEVKEWYELL